MKKRKAALKCGLVRQGHPRAKERKLLLIHPGWIIDLNTNSSIQ